MDDNFTNAIAVADVAEFCGLPRRGLNRRFKATMGISLNWHIIEQRIQRVRRQLEGPSGQRRPLEHIADACGFTGTDQLERHFRRLMGVTPEQYRRNHG
ncbi:MAG: AraC family transcriptional regulator [Planctomycetota bacterium]